MPKEEVVQLVADQMSELQAEHPYLELALSCLGKLIVKGTVRFLVEHEGRAVKDEYQIKMILPNDYPDSPPSVWETGRAIPDGFHKFAQIKNLCLGAPVEVRRAFAKHKTLLGFVN